RPHREGYPDREQIASCWGALIAGWNPMTKSCALIRIFRRSREKRRAVRGTKAGCDTAALFNLESVFRLCAADQKSPSPPFRGEREGPRRESVGEGERLSGLSRGIGELAADIACFGVEADEEFASEGHADELFGFAGLGQS